MTRVGAIVARIVALAAVASTPSDAAGTDACPAPPSRGEITGALLGIYYWTDHPADPPPFSLPGPQEASHILACDTSPGASSRRRRAIGRLARALGSRGGGGRATALERHVFDVSLATLGAPEGLVEEIEDASRNGADTQVAIETFLDKHPSVAKELSYARGCCACLLECTGSGPDSQGLAAIDFRVELDGMSIEDAEHTIDPQNWSKCDEHCQA